VVDIAGGTLVAIAAIVAADALVRTLAGSKGAVAIAMASTAAQPQSAAA
jgi:hypothetical protein